MKSRIILLLPLLFAVIFSQGQHPHPKKKSIYYYCWSKSAQTISKAPSKIHITYTDVMKMDNNEDLINKRVKEWAEYMNAHCQNKPGCTSDFNIASSVADGKQQISNILSKYGYGDTSKYIITKVSF